MQSFRIYEAVADKRERVVCSEECYEYISIIRNKACEFEFSSRSTSLQHSGSDSETRNNRDIPLQLTKSSLSTLHAKLSRTQRRVRANERRWKNLVQSARRVEALLQGEPIAIDESWCKMGVSSSSVLSSESSSSSCVRWLHDAVSFIYEFWINKCFSITCRVLSVCCSVASIVILWSEMMMATSLESPLGGVIKSFSGKVEEAVVVQSVAFVALFYMSICTYWSLFQINFGWQYKLAGPQLSAYPSLIFNAQYFARLQFSLGFNFLMTLNMASSEKTAFNSLMSNIAIVPLFGTSFTVYTPVIMIIIALMTLFNVYGRVLRMFGFDSEELIGAALPCFSNGKIELSEEDKEVAEAGKKLVDAQIRREVKSSALQSRSPASRNESDKESLIRKGALSSSASPASDDTVINFKISSSPVTHARIESGKTSYAPIVQMTKLKPKEVDIDAILDDEIEEFDFNISGHGAESCEFVDSESNTASGELDDDEPMYYGRYSNV